MELRKSKQSGVLRPGGEEKGSWVPSQISKRRSDTNRITCHQLSTGTFWCGLAAPLAPLQQGRRCRAERWGREPVKTSTGQDKPVTNHAMTRSRKDPVNTE